MERRLIYALNTLAFLWPSHLQKMASRAITLSVSVYAFEWLKILCSALLAEYFRVFFSLAKNLLFLLTETKRRMFKLQAMNVRNFLRSQNSENNRTQNHWRLVHTMAGTAHTLYVTYSNFGVSFNFPLNQCHNVYFYRHIATHRNHQIFMFHHLFCALTRWCVCIFFLLSPDSRCNSVSLNRLFCAIFNIW